MSLFLQGILNSSTGQSIMGEDGDGTIVLWNEGARRDYGYLAEEVVGRESAGLLCPPGDRETGENDRMKEVALEAGRWEGVVDRLRKDGSRFPARVVLTPQIDGEGRLRGFLTISEDISEELDLERRWEEAEERVSSLTKDLDAFSYSVSHDLRAPLRHIHGFTYLLEKGAGDRLDSTCRRYLATIAESANRLSRLIDALLVYSRIGRAEMERIDLDLNEVLRETLDKLQPAIGSRDIRWKIGSLPTVQGDPAMLRQVFANLLGNAVKFTRDRDPAEIEIGAAEEQDNVVIFFRDNGAGFDMEYADRLFGVFQRLHHADEFAGTGIGLANVKRMIARHGGKIRASGKVNEGATFSFLLPRQDATRFPPKGENARQPTEANAPS